MNQQVEDISPEDPEVTILIVDDTPENLQSLEHCLGEAGYQVVVASSGLDGLRGARLVQPDLILLDAMMPEVDGFETCRRLKQDSELAEIPVIFLTALDEPHHRLKAFEIGAVDYLTKPVEIMELMARVNTHVRLRRTQRKLEEKTRHLEQIFHNSAVFMALLDNYGNYLDLNAACDSLLGYSREELLGYSWLNLFPLEAHSEMREQLQQLRRGVTGRAHEECQLLRKDGQRIWVNYWLSPLRDGQGRCSGLICVINDLSDRRRMEEDLKENQHRLEMALEAAQAGTFYYDFLRDENQWDARSLEIFGLKDGEFPGTYAAWQERVHPEDLPKVERRFQQVATRGGRFDSEFRIIRPNGEIRHIHGQAMVVTDAQGQPLQASGLHIDVTARKQAEDLFQRNLEILNETQRLTRMGGWELDVLGGRLEWTEEMFYIYEVEPDYQPELQESLNFFHPESRKTVWQAIQEAVEKGWPFDVEGRFITARQHERWLRVIGNPRYQEGKVSKVTGSFQDITGRKETELLLQQAKEAAESANRAKSSFLANMSHELRTPLNGILGYAQLLEREESFSSQQRNSVQIIRRSGEYLLTLLNDILDLSKIEAGRFELFPTPFSPENFFRGLVELFQVRAEQKNVAFRYWLQGTLPCVLIGDERRLRQILLNLLGNAIKFTEQGEVSLFVEYLGGRLHMKVEDSGIGINSEDMQRLFQPFQQVGGDAYKTQGTGLGLAICHRLIHLMDGHLEVESEPGQGSVFRVVLPLLETKPEMIGVIQENENRPLPQGYRPLGEKKIFRILVVDDIQENREMLVSLLAPLGFELRQAVDGEDCLAQTAEWRPDVILMDLRMPRLDGLAATRALRARPGEFGQPIILAVSASTFDQNREQSLEAGCEEHIPKPVEIQGLLETLSHYLPLTWEYPETAGDGEQTLEPEDRGRPLNAEEKAYILKLSATGNIKGIQDYLDHLAEENSDALLEKLRREAARFSIKSIRGLLRE